MSLSRSAFKSDQDYLDFILYSSDRDAWMIKTKARAILEASQTLESQKCVAIQSTNTHSLVPSAALPDVPQA